MATFLNPTNGGGNRNHNVVYKKSYIFQMKTLLKFRENILNLRSHIITSNEVQLSPLPKKISEIFFYF